MIQLLFWFMVISLAIVGFFMVRNELVCRVRIKLLWEDRDVYYRLPSYDRMWLEFWKLPSSYERKVLECYR